MESKLLDILNNLCNMFIDDGQIPEEVIEMLVDAGADANVLNQIGFNESQLQDYAYYEANMSGRTEEEILSDLYS